jgi:hypothetical protein
MLHVKGGSATLDAPLLAPKSRELARTIVHTKERPIRTLRVLVHDAMSDIASEYFAVIRTKRSLDELET